MKKQTNARGDGCFYRRYKQKQYPIDSDVPGTIYYTIQSDNERVRICCHTKSLPVAKRLVSKYFTEIDLTSPQRFLETISKAGEKARRKLENDLFC